MIFNSKKPENFNPSQQKAVLHCDGNLLIVAGPGTGKTHTLAHRITRIAKTVANDRKILAVTFTNKAAIEMSERLSKLLPEKKDICFIGTFHQFCLQTLKKYNNLTALPENFIIASPDEVKLLVEDKSTLEQISRWKSLYFDQPMPEEVKIYNEKLRKNSWLDFDDLLLEMVRLLKNQSDLLEDICIQYPYIFVDEYQDINCIQHTLLKLLVGKKSCITAIGDPNQAIYGFRGSDVKYFRCFEKDFSNAHILSLEENYRCTQNILFASTQVMSKQKSGDIPELIARIYGERKLIVHESSTDKAEAEYVVHQIEKLIGGTSMFSQDSGRVDSSEMAELSFGDIAIFYRLNSQRFALQKALDRSGIPYEVFGVKKKVSSNTVVEDLYDARNDDICVNAEKISLMTIHASKGLEFPCVFIIGCENSILPLNLNNLTSDIEEERRLFYVGMTRAKERLFLIYAKKRYLYGKFYQNTPSPFLADIEDKLKEYEQQQYKPKKQKKEDPQMTLF